MAIQIQIRRDTASNWSSNNPTLSEGEIGFSTDTRLFKIGNGSSAWNSLSYYADLSSASAAIVSTASAAAVSAIVDGAPGALDTLNELAAALNDDASIISSLLTAATASATYLTQASASSTYLTEVSASTVYAKIASPTFTGTVTIPTLDLTNALAIADGGTGATTATAAANAILPSQTSNSGKYLTTDGTNTSWGTVTSGGGGTASDDTIFKAQLFFGGSN